MKKKKLYMGNNPNSLDYDPNLPIGTNKWDEQEFDDSFVDARFDDDEEIPDENTNELEYE